MCVYILGTESGCLGIGARAARVDDAVQPWILAERDSELVGSQEPIRPCRPWQCTVPSLRCEVGPFEEGGGGTHLAGVKAVSMAIDQVLSIMRVVVS